MGVLVGKDVSVGAGVDVLVEVGVALGGMVAVGKVLLRVDSETVVTIASDGTPCGVANTKRRAPPMNKHPKRMMPPPSNIGNIRLIDWLESFCSMVLSQ
jgi:hypothetical protein